jgi:glycerophosphoryl diester phosphodiesterase
VGLVAAAGGGAEALDGTTVPLWFGGEKTRAGVSIMPYGARSASALKERKGVVVGHRGMSGAGDVVEHTMAAYTRAVECGVDALEISCHRTSDGVWFASHDSTLERLGGPSTPIKNMTWAQVQAAFAGRPEALPVTLKDYLGTYGNTHVTIFDPKTEMARSDEYLALLKDYKDRVVIKAFADAGWLFAKVKQAGWATWGYAYARNRGQTWYADFAAATNLDFLSMEWNAADDVWTPLVATKKPVIAHIPATVAQAAEGVRKGAAGCITSRADLVAGLKV